MSEPRRRRRPPEQQQTTGTATANAPTAADVVAATGQVPVVRPTRDQFRKARAGRRRRSRIGSAMFVVGLCVMGAGVGLYVQGRDDGTVPTKVESQTSIRVATTTTTELPTTLPTTTVVVTVPPTAAPTTVAPTTTVKRKPVIKRATTTTAAAATTVAPTAAP